MTDTRQISLRPAAFLPQVERSLPGVLFPQLVKKASVFALALAGLYGIAAPAAYAGSVTVGTYGNSDNNLFPFNDPSFDGGLIRYQEHYSASAFGGSPVTIDSLTFFSISNFVGDKMAAATFDIYLSYAANSLGHDTNTGNSFNSNVGAGQTLFAVFTNPSTQPSAMTITGSSPFVYDPSQGDLLLDIVPVSYSACQSPCGGFEADPSKSVIDRNWSTPAASPGVGTTINDDSALVTRFNIEGGTSAAPEPATFFAAIGVLATIALRKRPKSPGTLF